MDILDAYELRKRTGLNFDDGLVLSSMKSLRIKQLVTFDQHFSNLEEIGVLTPDQAIKITQTQEFL